MSLQILGLHRLLGFDSLTEPNLDDGLARHSDEGSLLIKFGDHPTRQIDIYPTWLKARSASTFPVEKPADNFAIVEATIKLFSGYGSLLFLHLLTSLLIARGQVKFSKV
jgi:hypothetical protein